MPLEPGPGAVDTDRETILLTTRHLRAHQRSLGAIFEPQQQVRVIVQTPTGDEGAQVRAQRLDAPAGDELQQIRRVRADVADATALPRARRIGPPGSLLVALRLPRFHQPVLAVLDHHLAQLAELPGAHHLARLAHRGVAGVV